MLVSCRLPDKLLIGNKKNGALFVLSIPSGANDYFLPKRFVALFQRTETLILLIAG